MISDLLQKYSLKRQAATYRLLIILIFLLFLTLSYFLAGLIKPLILAIFFAYALNPLVEKMENKGVPSALAVTISLLSIFVVLSLIGYLFYINISSFINDGLSIYERKFEALYVTLKKLLEDQKILNKETGLNTEGIKNILLQGKNYIISIFTGTSSFLSDFLLFIFYLCFLLPGIRNFRIKTNRAFDNKKSEKINLVNERIVSQIQQYIITKSLVSFATGMLVYITGLIFGLDLALVWGVLAFILNFIPSIGSLIASIFPIFLAVLQFESTLTIVIFSVTIVLIQFIIGNILEPKLFSKSLSLSSLIVFLSLVFFGWLWGIIGAILSVPIMATVSIICQNIPSLRPAGLFLQSSFPLIEDQERLSLIYHVAYADNELQEQEKRHIEAELQKELYNPLSIRLVWKNIQKKPLSLEEIFAEKEPWEKIDLYHLACKIAFLDDNISKHEQTLLQEIQVQYARLIPESISKIHELIYLERHISGKQLLKIKSTISEDNDLSKEQLAYSYKLLARKYFEQNQKTEARDNYNKALEIYTYLEIDNEILDCSQKLAVLG